MLFNSLAFLVFLPIVWVLYWGVFSKRVAWRNAFLIIAGYVFYGWWDWRFLILLFMSSLVDYVVGILLSRTERNAQRKALLGFSLITQLGLLATFKYFDWFTTSFAQAMATLGWQVDPFTLGLILPVGISFYTFQTLSYTIDVYRRKTDAVRDPIQFFAFVGFFPQLMAGPIERASHMLPQFGMPAVFDLSKAKDGLRQMLWGLFKKVVIADGCAVHVNHVFDDVAAQPGSTLLVAAIFFAVQIYCDFSGYSDIAIGCARLFGFDLMRNFAYPFFSRDMGELWRRWHISLSTWFRDYLYLPLGGSRGALGMQVRNVMIVFLVSGLWHGANWTFLVWGGLNGLFLVWLLLRGKHRANTDIVAQGRLLPSPREALQVITTFLLFVLVFVFFRAANLGQAWDILSGIARPSLFTYPAEAGLRMMPLVLLMLAVEWLQRERQHGLQIGHINAAWKRWGMYYAVLAAIILLGSAQQKFIYFDF